MFYQLKYDLIDANGGIVRAGSACIVKRSKQIVLKQGGSVNRVDIIIHATNEEVKNVDPTYLIPVMFYNAGE